MVVKKKINVIDLDNTLLPYNSFTRFVLYFMIHWKLFFPILFLSFLRILWILRRDSYQKRILLLTRKTQNYETRLQEFSLMLYKDIKTTILRFIKENTDDKTINVLCTASPEDYVRYLCKKIKGWSCLCSTFDDQSGAFYHMYGPNKVTALTQYYPSNSYIYHVAISDSETDLELLRLFDMAFRIKKKKFKRLDLNSTTGKH